jgi:hypothetical protein
MWLIWFVNKVDSGFWGRCLDVDSWLYELYLTLMLKLRFFLLRVNKKLVEILSLRLNLLIFKFDCCVANDFPLVSKLNSLGILSIPSL